MPKVEKISEQKAESEILDQLIEEHGEDEAFRRFGKLRSQKIKGNGSRHRKITFDHKPSKEEIVEALNKSTSNGQR